MTSSPINRLCNGIMIAISRATIKEASMIAGLGNGGSYLRPAQTYSSRATLPPAEAAAADGVEQAAVAENATRGIAVSALRKLDMSGLKIIAVEDNPELRDLMATNWLQMQAAQSAFAQEVPDNAPQNTYATIKVDGKVVATLYNAGSSAMTN